jgi:hypothetical protein
LVEIENKNGKLNIKRNISNIKLKQIDKQKEDKLDLILKELQEIKQILQTK